MVADLVFFTRVFGNNTDWVSSHCVCAIGFYWFSRELLLGQKNI